MAAHSKKGTMPPARAYLARCQLFSLKNPGRWPLHARQRPQDRRIRGWAATTSARPDPPPAGMSDAELTRAKALLEKGGWTLVLAQGVWVPCRTI